MSDLTPESKGARDDGAFSIDIRVYYEDTDAAGVVYYANYLRFMERARSDWLRALNITMDVTSQGTERGKASGNSWSNGRLIGRGDGNGQGGVTNSGREARRERALEESLVTATEPSTDTSSNEGYMSAGSREPLPIFVVRRAEIDYGRPARLNDLLKVDVRLDDESRERRLRGAAFWLRQSVTRVGAPTEVSGFSSVAGKGSSDDADQVLVQGRIQVASIDPHSFRPRRLPPWVVERVMESIA